MNKLYENAGLTPEEATLMPSYIDGDVDFYDTPAYDKLYAYLAFEVCLMPYGVAKARTGDPDVWILEFADNVIKEDEPTSWLQSYVLSNV
jgi:hypothetical protein